MERDEAPAMGAALPCGRTPKSRARRPSMPSMVLANGTAAAAAPVTGGAGRRGRERSDAVGWEIGSGTGKRGGTRWEEESKWRAVMCLSPFFAGWPRWVYGGGPYRCRGGWHTHFQTLFFSPSGLPACE